MSSISERARKHMAELEETYKLQHLKIEQLYAELAKVKENNEILSDLNCNLEEKERGWIKSFEENEQRLSVSLGLFESLKNEEVFGLEKHRNFKELLEYIDENWLRSEKETFVRKLAENLKELQGNEQTTEVIKKMHSDLKAKNEKLMATIQQLTMKFQNLYEKLMATMPQLKMKFNQLCEENRKIPELMAEVDRLGQQLSHGRVLKGDDVAS